MILNTFQKVYNYNYKINDDLKWTKK